MEKMFTLYENINADTRIVYDRSSDMIWIYENKHDGFGYRLVYSITPDNCYEEITRKSAE